MNMNVEIQNLLAEGTSSVASDSSRTGEKVRIKVVSEKISKRETSVVYQVVGQTGELYDTFEGVFPSLPKPYYHIEVLKLALCLYWSGTQISKRHLRRMEFIDKYGEQHQDYLDRSLGKLYWLKKLVFIWKRP
jgi:hypothetical protein